MQITPIIQAEFDEQIALFFHRAKSKADAVKQLGKHCEEMLSQLSEMLPILSEYPVYAGIAFYGKMQIGDRALIARLSSAHTPAQEAVASVRSNKALKVAASAKSGWDFLFKNDQEALWSAIQLNAHAVKVTNTPAEDVDQDEQQEDDEAELSNDNQE